MMPRSPRRITHNARRCIGRLWTATGTDKDGWTALHSAADNGHKDVVALLLDKYPDLVAATDKDGWTALHSAANYGHRDVVALLLGKMDDASINAKAGNYGRTALHS